MGVLEIGLVVRPDPDGETPFVATISKAIEEFGLQIGRDVIIRSGEDFNDRDRHAACAVAYLGSPAQHHTDIAARALRDSVPVIPTIPSDGDFGVLITKAIQGANGLRIRAEDAAMRELAYCLLECVGLLRQQRRLFVSYRRVASRRE